LKLDRRFYKNLIRRIEGGSGLKVFRKEKEKKQLAKVGNAR